MNDKHYSSSGAGQNAADPRPSGEQFDRALASALHNVPVPAGLENRLLAALAAHDCQPAAHHSPTHRSPILRSRRAWCVVATAAAVLLMVAALGRSWLISRHVIEQEQIASALGGWQKAMQTNRSDTGWPRDFVLPKLDVKPVRYVPFKTAEGWSAVAVDCTTDAGRPATLFIVRSTAKFRVPTTPATRLTASSGKSVAAWRSGHLLYVLVVEDLAKKRTDFSRVRAAARSA